MRETGVLLSFALGSLAAGNALNRYTEIHAKNEWLKQNPPAPVLVESLIRACGYHPVGNPQLEKTLFRFFSRGMPKEQSIWAGRLTPALQNTSPAPFLITTSSTEPKAWIQTGKDPGPDLKSGIHWSSLGSGWESVEHLFQSCQIPDFSRKTAPSIPPSQTPHLRQRPPTSPPPDPREIPWPG